MKNYIGCSGYHYDDWKDKFYPETVKKKDWLRYYAQSFNSVEINATFYRLQQESTIKKWIGLVPEDFKFTFKGNRFVTHQKRLNEPNEPVSNFYQSIEPAGNKIGCVLWQLPASLQKHIGKLKRFCEVLNPDFNNVIEFRHNSWFNQEVYNLLEQYKVGFCILSAPDGLRDDVITTTTTTYMRFHGYKSWYRGLYTEKELEEWAKKLVDLKGINNRYIYFNNDIEANAPRNAKMMQEIIKKLEK